MLMMPEGENFSFLFGIKTNGLSTTKIENFLTSFNIENLDLNSKKMRKIAHEVNDEIIKIIQLNFIEI